MALFGGPLAFHDFFRETSRDFRFCVISEVSGLPRWKSLDSGFRNTEKAACTLRTNSEERVEGRKSVRKDKIDLGAAVLQVLLQHSRLRVLLP